MSVISWTYVVEGRVSVKYRVPLYLISTLDCHMHTLGATYYKIGNNLVFAINCGITSGSVHVCCLHYYHGSYIL